jgi:hypothetical protein
MSVNQRGAKTAEMVPNWFKSYWTSIRNKLREEDWESQLADCDAGESWEIFRNKITILVNEHVPMRPRRTPNRPV